MIQSLPEIAWPLVPQKLPLIETPASGLIAMVAGFNLQPSGGIFREDGTVEHGPIQYVVGFEFEVEIQPQVEDVADYSGWMGPPAWRPEYVVTGWDGAFALEVVQPRVDLADALRDWQLTAMVILCRGNKYQMVGALSSYGMELDKSRWIERYDWCLILEDRLQLSWPEPLPPVALPPVALPPVALPPVALP